jgi:1-acyl-sn-glycerol-3-phosphate acyltransferase
MLKELKPGAARMAQTTQCPLVPAAVWGGQRMYTKGRPRDWHRGKAITVLFGDPFQPGKQDDTIEVTAELGRRISALLDRAQRSYPDQPSGPDDTWWLPASLGGTAPTPEQAAELDRREHVTEPQPPADTPG